MNRKSVHAVLCAVFLLGAGSAFAQQKAEGVRPEVGKPLQAAQALIKQRKGREAMHEIAIDRRESLLPRLDCGRKRNDAHLYR